MLKHTKYLRSTYYHGKVIKKLTKEIKKKDTFNTLLSAIELCELVCKYLLTKYTIHPTTSHTNYNEIENPSFISKSSKKIDLETPKAQYVNDTIGLAIASPN